MCNRNHWRGVARIAAPLSAVTLAFLISCVDTPVTSAPNDEWAEAATINTQFRMQMTLFDRPGRPTIQAGPLASSVPVLRGWHSTNVGTYNRAFSHSGRGRITIQHFRHGDSLTTVGLYFDEEGAPPKFTYLFENARIQAIVSSKYARHGRGYVRVRSRTTLFDDDGRPKSQTDAGSDLTARAPDAIKAGLAAATRAVADVALALAPKSLQAEEVPMNCFSQWITYTTASAVLAAASTAVSAAAAACVGTLISCPAVDAAAIAWLLALDRWQVALDKLTDCIAANSGPTNTTGTGGAIETPGTGGPRYPTTVIEEFINSAIDSGNYSCTSNGDYCTYYAA